MANNPKAVDNIKPYMFEKGQSGNPKGRPPKLLTDLMKDLKAKGYEQVTSGQIVEAYETLFGLDELTLKTVVANKELPMVSRIVAKAMLSTRGFEILERMLDRAQGRPKQSIDADVSGAVNVALVEFLKADDNGNNQNKSTDTE